MCLFSLHDIIFFVFLGGSNEVCIPFAMFLSGSVGICKKVMEPCLVTNGPKLVTEMGKNIFFY